MNFPDYLLIKDLPGHKKGSRFTMGKNYIYYISYEPDKEGWIKLEGDFIPEEDSLVRFNIHTMKTFVDWFLEITPEIERELKLEQLGI